jgi:hypothetical protein
MVSNTQPPTNPADHSETASPPPRRDYTILKLFAGLVACCLALTYLAGDIGFQGDDWWILSWPFWNGLLDAVWLYAKASLRPIEGIYWISIFEAFGFHRQIYHFFSLMLAAGACAAMGACLIRAFPEKRDFAVLSSLFAFFLPTVAPLTYLIHTDNSRLALLLFWTSVLAFQRWADRTTSWSGLAVPVALYCLAALTYENCTLLIFAVPLFIWPVHARSGGRLWDTKFLARTSVGVFGAFAFFLLIRFFVLSGGAVGHRSLTPPLHLFVGYAVSLARYLATPFVSVTSDGTAWLWGACAVAVAVWLLFLNRERTHSISLSKIPLAPFGKGGKGGICVSDLKAKSNETNVDQVTSQGPGSLYVAGLGALVLGLGTAPYLLAGYSAELGFTSQSRVYSSGTFGLAMLLALGFTFWKSPRILAAAKAVSVVALLFMAVFMAGLSNDWRQAAQQRRELCAQLLEKVPDVKPGTTFLFLDLQSYVSNRAVVVQGTDGLNEFIKMMYRKKPVCAYFLYPSKARVNDVKGKTATVTPEGIVPRGCLSSAPKALDTLLILRRTGSRLTLVDSICANDGLAAIDWKGVSSIRSNPDRILQCPERSDAFREICIK